MGTKGTTSKKKDSSRDLRSKTRKNRSTALEMQENRMPERTDTGVQTKTKTKSGREAHGHSRRECEERAFRAWSRLPEAGEPLIEPREKQDQPKRSENRRRERRILSANRPPGRPDRRVPVQLCSRLMPGRTDLVVSRGRPGLTGERFRPRKSVPISHSSRLIAGLPTVTCHRT